MNSSERLYTLIGDLPPALLEEAFPEASRAPTSWHQFRSRKHIRRIGRAIAIYAACATLIVGLFFLIPFLTRTTDPLGDTVPEGYYRPDLIWANDSNLLRESDPIGTEAPGKLYISFTFPENAPADARYAVAISLLKEDLLRSADTNDYYYLTDEDRKAFQNHLLSLGCEIFEVGECHPLTTGLPGLYFAATRAQIEALDPTAIYNAMGLNLTEIPGITVKIQYQILEEYEIPEYWDLDAKKQLRSQWPYHVNFYSRPGSNSSLKLEPITPVINQKKQNTITLTFTHGDTSCDEYVDCALTHTYSQNYSMCLQVLVNNDWYYIPISHVESADTEKDQHTITHGTTDTITVRLNELYGTLPDGFYRFALNTVVPSISSDWKRTAYAEFVIDNGQKARIVADPESERLLRDDRLIFDARVIEMLEIGTTYEEITAQLGAPVLDVTGEGKVFRHPTKDGFPIDLTYAYSNGALRLVSMQYAVEKVTDFPEDYYRPDLIWANGVNTDAMILHSAWYRVNNPGPYFDMMGMYGFTNRYLTLPDDPSEYAIYVTWEIEARFETDQVVPADYAQRLHRYLTETVGLKTLKIDPRLSPTETPTGCYYIATRNQLDQFDFFEMKNFVEHPSHYSLTLSFHLGYQPVESD